MAYNRNHARAMLTDTERELFEISLSDRVGELSRAELVKKVQRSRKLRDKYTDLYRRQSLETRARTGTKRGSTGQANARTQQKADMFGEVLARFEAHLDRIDRAAAKESKRAALERSRKAKGGGGRTTPKKSARARKKAPSGGTAPDGPKEFMTEGAAAARDRGKIASPRNKSISAHVGAKGRRNQAKRDAR
ncbi:MAG: hypothetical protein ACXIVQ_10215 [Acidimicrobiales bacterium]